MATAMSMETNGETQEEEKVVTLVEAIKEKYSQGPPQYYEAEILHSFRTIKETSPKSKPGATPIEKQTYLIIERKNISHSGPNKELASMCPCVKELHIGLNGIKSWEPIITILSSLPSLQILDLIHNEFLFQAPLHLPAPHSALKTLIMSCTNVSFASVVSVMSMLPNLSELHLSNNMYNDSSLELLDVDDIPQHQGLVKLFFVENQLTQWNAIEVLGDLFPNLQTLLLNDNPVREIMPTEATKFPNLQTLNLNKSQVNLWESVENLASYPQLVHLSLRHVPIGNDMNEKERRFAMIARLPSMQLLNKSVISEEERQDAERWLIREYINKPNQPRIYQNLVAKHGMLKPLVEVNLAPKKEVSVEFQYEGIDRHSDIHKINTHQTTKQLRCWIGRTLLLVPPSKLRLFYTDTECVNVYASEEMRIDSKELYRYGRYGIKDGDLIEVVLKQ